MEKQMAYRKDGENGMISYIIPHKNRNGLLDHHLKSLQNSVFNDYEVIVVDDGSDTVPERAYINEKWAGPGGARSYGASIAKGDITMFVGDDTLPSEDLLLWHWYAHKTNPDADVVQGYTMFHPSVLGTYFMSFLDKSGFQANWNSLKTSDGKWKRDANGFFLTTNVSIKKSSWDRIGEFSHRFSKAAWEDVEFGVKLQRNHFKTIFEPSAINFHFHSYNYQEFCQRQKTEGYERLNICLEHAEMAPTLISPEMIRNIEQISEIEILTNGARMVNMAIPKLREIQENMWGEGLQAMSIIGLRNAINDRGGIFNVLNHLHTHDEVTMVFSALRAIEKGDFGYAQHCKAWILDKSKEDWAILAFASEIDLACGDKGMAKYFWNKANKLAHNEAWVKEIKGRIDGNN
jgi:glycosyltransferase involved in cell wall biosynthesis